MAHNICYVFPQNQIDQLTMELGTEKSATQKLESGKLVLERQNKELKAKLAELETAARTKTKVRLSMVCEAGKLAARETPAELF